MMDRAKYIPEAVAMVREWVDGFAEQMESGLLDHLSVGFLVPERDGAVFRVMHTRSVGATVIPAGEKPMSAGEWLRFQEERP